MNLQRRNVKKSFLVKLLLDISDHVDEVLNGSSYTDEIRNIAEEINQLKLR